VDIVPVMPHAPADDQNAATSVGGSPAATSVASIDPELYPQTAVRRTPVALRVEQTLANSVTPARTVFALTRNFGCWWLRF
jgi:hypothetical protein